MEAFGRSSRRRGGVILVPVEHGGLSRRDQVVDMAIAAAFVALSVVLSVALVDGAVKTSLALALGVVHSGSLSFRRRRPIGVVVVMAATAVLCVAAGLPVVVLGPAVIVAMYTVGAREEPAGSKRVLVGVLVVTALVVLASGADAATVVTNSIVLSVAWWLGARSFGAAMETEAERAASAEAARRAVIDERLRIAREMHDVVAHAMSVIAVQAGTGRFVIEQSPDVAAEALATIETTSRAALQELRRLLTVLRDEDLADEPLTPAPGVRDLDGLVEANAQAGLDVQVLVRGEPSPLPAGVDQCVYRVVQEALTNVRKHARVARAVVTLEYDESTLGVEVRDDGVGSTAASGSGHGIVGMRERVELYGGRLEIGAARRGFRVAARLPVEDNR
jgi:signal transduction histidine kinase